MHVHFKDDCYMDLKFAEVKKKKEYTSYRQYNCTSSAPEKPSSFQRKTDFSGKIAEKNKRFDELVF